MKLQDLLKSNVCLAGFEKFKIVRNANVRDFIRFVTTPKSAVVQSHAFINPSNKQKILKSSIFRYSQSNARFDFPTFSNPRFTNTL